MQFQADILQKTVVRSGIEEIISPGIGFSGWPGYRILERYQ